MSRVNVCLFIVLMVSAIALQAQPGVKIGGNLSTVGIFGNSEEGESESFKPGFQGGLFYKAGISEMFSVVVEVNYETRGTISKKNYTVQLPVQNPIDGSSLGIGDYQIAQEIDSKQAYVNLPVFVLLGNGYLKGYVGANVGYLISGKADLKRTVDVSLAGTSISNSNTDLGLDWQEYDSFKNVFMNTPPTENGDFLNSLDFGINFGAMYYVAAGFIVDLRVSQGFADSTNNHYDRSIYPSEDFTFEGRTDTDRNFSVQFGVGYFF